ncbi:pimeloyl-ACP methyl ester carboxylesterase [Micromonospora pisi]|uniref:Pimeloyl-ACP methyl ester carboxylesterase n=1 Tax=Micromonospora pisi TaxID=589240 RepID=A0A495JID6_9ACTN|nr:alpha/beta fold hydrolase [Micromonospora pisi]RKR88683.1 pimeloyl-ACP methyl ester carboxylesterase [Micromonospora pisi]
MLIHGIGSDWRMWQPVLPRLAPTRDTIALDLPGYGDSPRTGMGARSGIGALADVVEGFLDQFGLPTAHLAGNSMGGWVALELARRGRARTATLLSPAGFYNNPEGVFVRASLLFSARISRRLAPDAERVTASRLRRTVLFAQFMGRPWRLPAHHAAHMMRVFASAPGFDADLAAITEFRFAGPLALADVPVTIGWGSRDRLLLPWQGRRAVRALPGSRLVPLPGVGHVPTHDDPELVADLLLEGSTTTG